MGTAVSPRSPAEAHSVKQHRAVVWQGHATNPPQASTYPRLSHLLCDLTPTQTGFPQRSRRLYLWPGLGTATCFAFPLLGSRHQRNYSREKVLYSPGVAGIRSGYSGRCS